MNSVTLQSNIATLENFYKIAGASPDVLNKINEGKICLGAKGDRLVVVNYGETRLSSLIQSIKNFFTGVKVGTRAQTVEQNTNAGRAFAHLAAQKSREDKKTEEVVKAAEKYTIKAIEAELDAKKAELDAKKAKLEFDASKFGKVYNFFAEISARLNEDEIKL